MSYRLLISDYLFPISYFQDYMPKAGNVNCG